MNQPSARLARLTGPWIENAGTQALCALLEGSGHRALFVGGCVRDALLRQPVADVDIATDARPERVLALAEEAGLRAVPTGLEHGTVTVISGGEAHEITTFRRDVETFGRHAVVAFSTDVAEDAARRDFTMNALYATPLGDVLDPLGGGLADLARRHVRFVGEPRARIAEDYLRILRFFRFHAWYGDAAIGPDPEGLAACAARADGIARLSAERVTLEIRRLLGAPDPAPAVRAMADSGVLGYVLPGASAAALTALVAIEGDAPPRWLRRLATLTGEAGTGRLRLSRLETRRLEQLRQGMTGAAGPAETAYRLGAEAAADVVLGRAARQGALPVQGWQDAIRHGAAACFPVRAADLMPGLSGPALGAALDRLEARWIASGFALDRETLLASRAADQG